MREITQQGIDALKSGDRSGAFRLLASAVRQDPNDLQAWLWLSGAVDSDAARMDCMRQVLRIDPSNPVATQGLARLLGKQPAPPTAVKELLPQKESPLEKQAAGLDQAAAPAPPAEEVRLPIQEKVELPEAAAGPVEAVPAPAPQPPSASPVEEAVPGPEIDAARAVYEQPGPPEDSVEMESSVSQPAGSESVAALAPGTPFYRPMPRSEVTYANYEQRIVFRIRPSQVPALISFWVFFFGAYFVGSQFTEPDYMFGTFLGFGLGIALELVILYIVITNFRTRYTLTSQELRLHIIQSDFGLPYARDITIPIRDIYYAECRQNFLQQLMGIADLHFDAAVDGQLDHMHLRGIPQCDHRLQQLMYLVREQQTANIFTREVS